MHAQSKSMGKALKLGGNWVTTDPLKRSFYYYGRMKKVNFRLMDIHLFRPGHRSAKKVFLLLWEDEEGKFQAHGHSFRPTVTAVVAMLSPRSCCWTARTALVPSMLTASRNCRATRNIQIKKSKKNCKNFAGIVHI